MGMALTSIGFGLKRTVEMGDITWTSAMMGLGIFAVAGFVATNKILDEIIEEKFDLDTDEESTKSK